ncbi:neprilysin-1-like protein, partial [Dinothrombium tinctorium]
IDQPAFGIKEKYLRHSSNFTNEIDSYKTFIRKSVLLLRPHLSIDAVNVEIEKIIDFETKLVKATTRKGKNPKMDNKPTSLTNLEKRQKIKWIQFFETLFQEAEEKFTGSEPVFMRDYDYFDSLNDILKQTEKRQEKNVEMRNNIIEFQRVQIALKHVPSAFEECYSNTLNEFKIAFGFQYIQDHYDSRMTKEVEKLIHFLKLSMTLSIQSNGWMDNGAKLSAQKKLNEMTAQIAKPSWLKTESDVNKFYAKLGSITGENYCANFIQLNKWKRSEMYHQLHNTCEKAVWHWELISAKAMYNINENQITFPAGILQPPFYLIDGLASMNFGTLGNIVSHEIIHGFDDISSIMETDGDFDDWSRRKTYEQFSSKTQCFINQYSNYEDDFNKNIDGSLTLKENIADNGGLRRAFMAYKLYKIMNQGKVSLRLPFQMQKFNDEQLFFISFGNSWCAKTRFSSGEFSEDKKHSSTRWRVIGSLSNFNEFSRVFSCRKNSEMNPSHKCTLW